MSVKQSINQKLDSLSEKEQKQVLEFVDLVHQRGFEKENEEWNQFSLEQAMKGLEDDNLPEYTEADLIERWQ